MADLSSIKLPNGTTYSIKDSSSVSGVSISDGKLNVTKRNGTTISSDLPIKEVTQSAYDALSSADKNNGTVYFITDGTGGTTGATAATTSYDNERSGLDGDSVQDAMDDLASYTIPVAIQSNSDLNNYTVPGAYYSTTGTVSATISNTPEALSAAFILRVYPFTTDNARCAQELFTASARYTRTKGSGTWGNWYKFTGTKLS